MKHRSNAAAAAATATAAVTAGLVTALALAACTVTTVEPPTGDASTTDAAAADGATPADGGTSEGGVGGEGCSFGEPNETRETATPITLDAEYKSLCFAAENDEDWFEITTPNDAAGGIVQIRGRNVGDGQLRIDPYVVADNGTFTYTYSESKGANVDLWFLVAPGAKYRLKATAFVGLGFSYDLSATYTKIDDAYEPNDTREQAKPITVGTAISAFHTAGYTKGELVDASFEDWFDVTLAAGNANVALTDVPEGVSLRLELFDPAGNSLRYELTGQGANVTLSEVVATPGTHKVRVAPFTGTRASDDTASLPQQVTRPYKLLVTQ